MHARPPAFVFCLPFRCKAPDWRTLLKGVSDSLCHGFRELTGQDPVPWGDRGASPPPADALHDCLQGAEPEAGPDREPAREPSQVGASVGGGGRAARGALDPDAQPATCTQVPVLGALEKSLHLGKASTQRAPVPTPGLHSMAQRSPRDRWPPSCKGLWKAVQRSRWDGLLDQGSRRVSISLWQKPPLQPWVPSTQMGVGCLPRAATFCPVI